MFLYHCSSYLKVSASRTYKPQPHIPSLLCSSPVFPHFHFIEPLLQLSHFVLISDLACNVTQFESPDVKFCHDFIHSQLVFFTSFSHQYGELRSDSTSRFTLTRFSHQYGELRSDSTSRFTLTRFRLAVQKFRTSTGTPTPAILTGLLPSSSVPPGTRRHAPFPVHHSYCPAIRHYEYKGRATDSAV